jgi:Conserved protein/domain typically associated with flavoprotein oxygenases, DIM6/NTAB family
MTATAQRLAASEQAAANRLPQRKRPMPPAFKLITDPTRESTLTPDFVDAMSTLASGVVLVTVWVADRPWGMTVTAFASVSAEPPTVLVSLGSETTSAREISATRSFGVSILAEEQLALARLGSEPGAAKFLEPFVDPATGAATVPVRSARSPTSIVNCRTPFRSPTTRSSSAVFALHVRHAAAGRSCTTPRLPDARRPCRGTPTD